MRWLLALCGVCMASVSTAQTIHQYPYDPTVTAYSSPSAWPLISGQCHWRPSNASMDMTTVPQLMSPSIGHTHMEVKSPIYSEVTGSFTVPFTVQLFHDAAQVSIPYGALIDNVTWDAGTAPIGDPNGLVVATGTMRINVARADGSRYNQQDIPARGWFTVGYTIRTFFDNGDRMDTELVLPYYSMLEPSQPETTLMQGGIEQGTVCAAGDNTGFPLGLFNIAQYGPNVYLPILAPITAPIGDAIPFGYGYGTSGSQPPGVTTTREDMDLHHGLPGTLIQTATSVNSLQGITLSSPFAPLILGPGLHKVAAMWEQDSGMGFGNVIANEQVSALLVVSVTVGTGTPPPPPPPPPMPVWVTLPGLFQQQAAPTPGLLQFCPTGGACFGVIKQ